MAERIELARAHLSAQHWEQAIRHLEDALAIERATNRDAVRPLLEQAQHGQAESLLEAAHLAIVHKDSANALQRLRAYAVHPQASDLQRARLLRTDLERATSSKEAARFLAHLSQDALTLFDKDGQITEDDGLHTDGAREIFKDTLRRHLANEMRKRQAQREMQRLAAERRTAERARQIARLRKTPVFRDLSAFAARTLALHREQQQTAQRQEKDFAQLFEQLGVNDKEEQATIRAELLAGESPESVQQSVERERTAIKRAYRTSPEFAAADRAAFERLVDEELNQLLKMVKES